MSNTKRFKKNSSKSRKFKKSARRNDNTTSRFITQTAGYNSIFGGSSQVGGSPTPAPRPAGPNLVNIYNLVEADLRNSLQQYGDAIDAIQTVTQTGIDIYNIPDGAPTNFYGDTPTYNELLLQYNAAKELQEAANNLMRTFSSTTGTIGLYQTIYGDTVNFIATPAPAPATSGGKLFSGGQGAPPPRAGLTNAILRPKLQAFGNAINVLKGIATKNNTDYKTNPDNLPELESGATGFVAYSSFVSQQIASKSIFDAITTTYESFAGTATYDPLDADTSRGLYRAILGDSENFSPTQQAAVSVKRRQKREAENARPPEVQGPASASP
jgi:hypothetical protein